MELLSARKLKLCIDFVLISLSEFYEYLFCVFKRLFGCFSGFETMMKDDYCGRFDLLGFCAWPGSTTPISVLFKCIEKSSLRLMIWPLSFRLNHADS